ncbi:MULTISPECIES: SDR family oxidoreductase [unclassified Devosia]|uniref:SDR family oxidoreductase n=1 Tax=unclassified Devosia TaxID=196773 RepID=UPI001555BE8E|nr:MULTISPECIES: SDR family oxidoreductase [unclassified Devosia]
MPAKLKPLSQQVIVITGATSGNGLATAEQAVRRGAKVVLAARSADDLERVAVRLRAGGGEVAICPADMADDAAAERIAQAAIDSFGGFETWVNNAAAATYGTMEQVTLADHRRVFEVNYFGVLMGSLVAARHLRAKGGAIINLGSVLSDRTMILQGPYSASKHAVQAATDALRMELEEEGAPISVTLIKPGAIHTPFPEHARNYLDAPPRLPPVLYDPELVADAILFAAEHPRRQLYVGGAGFLITLAGRLAPRLTDRLLEGVGRPLQIAPWDPGDPSLRDNLYQPRTDGKREGNQNFHVRRHSTLLAAQKHPLAATLIAGLVGAVVLSALQGSGGKSRHS